MAAYLDTGKSRASRIPMDYFKRATACRAGCGLLVMIALAFGSAGLQLARVERPRASAARRSVWGCGASEAGRLRGNPSPRRVHAAWVPTAGLSHSFKRITDDRTRNDGCRPRRLLPTVASGVSRSRASSNKKPSCPQLQCHRITKAGRRRGLTARPGMHDLSRRSRPFGRSKQAGRDQQAIADFRRRIIRNSATSRERAPTPASSSSTISCT